jgi:hypothetical protein
VGILTKILALLERIHGHGVGISEGIIAAIGLPIERVTPQVWKKEFGISGDDKNLSRLKAQQLIPRRRASDVGEAPRPG